MFLFILRDFTSQNLKYPFALGALPRPLNKVANDKGIVVKDLQNYIHEYVYTWDKPGTYEVVFVGRNENYAASSEQIHKYTITILEKPSAE